MGRLFVQFTAILDEWYAADISQRAKDSVAHRKAKGQSIGMPPFGTNRAPSGYLQPTLNGAWLLEDGTFIAGVSNEPPSTSAAFRGYYAAAEHILELYAADKYGLDKIAYLMNEGGWAFRDRNQSPRAFTSDDIRRIVANWSEYGGIPRDRKATARPAYEAENFNAIPFIEERAVFPIQLVRMVAEVRHRRSYKPADHGKNKEVRFYPLAGITKCSHCEQASEKTHGLQAHSFLSGQYANGILRYRHKPGVNCGISNRSVPAVDLETDFLKLIGLLTIKPELQSLMVELAIQVDKSRRVSPQPDLEQEKAEAIALCHRRIEAAVNLYRDGTIDRAEYIRLREQNEREIAHWESRTSETEKLGLEFALCIEAVNKIVRLWEISSEEDRQGLARNLFTSITYDLDTRRITDFRLKPWADRFLMMRANLYDYEETKTPQLESQGVCTDVLHTGFGPVFWP